MSTPIRIDPGLPPLLWSKVQQAFDNINQNFTTVYASIEGGGITPVDFGNLSTNVSPSTNSTYDLGNSLKKWRDLHISGDLNIGSATITSVGSAVNLPSGSTIGGSLLDQEYFRNIEVSGQPTLIADAGGDATLTINPGAGVSITTNAGTDTINFTNTGIISASAGAGISVSGTNPLQITNAGIISASAGTGISVSGTNPLQITNTGVTRIEAGNGMIVDVNTGTVTITNGSPASTLRCFEYINLGTGGIVRADNNFDTLNVAGDEHILINKVGSAASNNIEITFNNRVDIIGSVFGEDSSVLVDATDGRHYGYFQGDITGSVFADDSTKLVDAVEGLIVGDIETSRLRTSETKIALGNSAGAVNQSNYGIAIGAFAGGTDQSLSGISIGVSAGSTGQDVNGIAIGANAGNTDQGSSTVAIGAGAGYNTQSNGAIAIGGSAGYETQGGDAIAIGTGAGANNQGSLSIAIGNNAGSLNQPSNSIILNATGTILDAATTGFYVAPLRNLDSGTFLTYDTTTKEITYTSSIEAITADLTGSVFADDSTILIDGVAGKIVGEVDNNNVYTNFIEPQAENSQLQIGDGNTSGGETVVLTTEYVRILSAVPSTSIGVSGDLVGSIAFDGTYMYYCTAAYDGGTNIWKRVAWSGDTW